MRKIVIAPHPDDEILGCGGYLLKSKSKISFIRLVEDNPLKILVIYNFLAMLELIQESKIKLSLGNGMNNFWIQKS